MTNKQASLVTSAVWIVVIGVGFFLLGSTFWNPSSGDSWYSPEGYENSSYSKWIHVPQVEEPQVLANHYGGFDTNYRTVAFSSKEVDPVELIQKSIDRNIQYKGEQVSWLKNRSFSLDQLFSVFLYGKEKIPGWWIYTYDRERAYATIAFWERDGYGYGYLVVLEPELDWVRVLQFSQQHANLDSLEQAFPEISAP